MTSHRTDRAGLIDRAKPLHFSFDGKSYQGFQGDTLRRGSEVSLEVPSASVARALFGLGVFLYRFGDEHRFRVHVAQSQAEPLLKSLKAMATCGVAEV
ncbi:hypothetical protein [Phaeobacter sp. HF9A]|uniref:hypothetical protein n=1 Tax=Phaeobacter sp. HF9A TaxID=2721561 RepID=UPI0014317E80|nr:hypothetical protein [Phaeobacter sp. HF9A]NIZ13037.1 hypothetical protein [Phaeobacter sp. HF9A]